MILYQSSTKDFKNNVVENLITDKISDSFIKAFGKKPNDNERMSWNNSMQFMGNIIRNSEVPDDCGVLIEFTIPPSSKRVDFIIAGNNGMDEKSFVIIELKQWESAEETDKNEIVRSVVGGNIRELPHPSYQAWSYKMMMDDMNESVYKNDLKSVSCSYLHNYKEGYPEPLKSDLYKDIIDVSPIYFKGDTKKLQKFIKDHVGKGEGLEILYELENGRIKPSKKLIDYVGELIKGNDEFILLDEQKVAFETILSFIDKMDGKKTVIVEGGPGTGKSVISVNSLGKILEKGRTVNFVAPNASFRKVVVEKLTASNLMSKTRLNHLFKGSSSYYLSDKNSLDVIIVDEAHRLKGEGAFMYQGDNQIEDIIKSSKVNVFFVDDNQRIRPVDIGTVEEIRRVANKLGSEVYEIKLEAQFRCSGAEGFINWIDTVLQYRDTGNFDGWDKESFEFKIFDSPVELRNSILEKNNGGFNSRLLAGYAWEWTKVNNNYAEVDDIIIEDYNFRMPWNQRSNSELWSIREEGINQVGCIHTVQGLEFDYVGVIIGNDMLFDNETMSVYGSYNNYKDSAGKKGLRTRPEELTELIKNIYRTLLTRGMKGCYIYCIDKDLQQHFKERLSFTEI